LDKKRIFQFGYFGDVFYRLFSENFIDFYPCQGFFYPFCLLFSCIPVIGRTFPWEKSSKRGDTPRAGEKRLFCADF